MTLAVAMALVATVPAGAADGADCFRQLERGRGSEIACQFPTRLTDKERAELERVTGGRLRDATCVVTIRVERARIDEAVAARDLDLEIPPQPVRCEVVTRDGVWPITGTFAPRVTFREGAAVDATPGLADVEGVSRALALPVVLYVNRSQTIRDGFLKVVNAYKAHYAVVAGGRR